MYANWMHHQDWQLRLVHSVHCILDRREIYRLLAHFLFIYTKRNGNYIRQHTKRRLEEFHSGFNNMQIMENE